MKKYRICFLVSTLQTSGPITVLYNIIQYIDVQKYEPWVLTLSPESSNSRWEDFVSLGVHCDTLGLSRMGMVLYGKRKLRIWIMNMQPDILHAHGFRPCVYITSYTADFQTCCTVHNDPKQDFVYTYGSFIGRWMYREYFSAIKQLARVIACSRAIAGALEQYIGATVTTIPNGIESTPCPMIFNVVRERERLQLPLDKKLMISVGVLSKRKDPLLIMRALGTLFQEKGWCCIFLGDGPERAICERTKTGALLLLGNVENVRQYLRCADAFISASHAEGMPNAVLEAMDAGLPILCSDIPPHREIYQLNNEIGYLFRDGDEEDLRDKFMCMDRAAATLRPMGRKAAQVVQHYFLAETMSKAYQDVYEDMLQMPTIGKGQER